jgi:hypothetical protein
LFGVQPPAVPASIFTPTPDTSATAEKEEEEEGKVRIRLLFWAVWQQESS